MNNSPARKRTKIKVNMNNIMIKMKTKNNLLGKKKQVMLGIVMTTNVMNLSPRLIT